MIASLQSVLDQDRMDFTKVASSIYDKACAVVGTEELLLPRVAGRQVHRDNVEAESASRSIFLSYIDGLSSSLRERFNDNPSFLRCFLSCLLTTRPTSIRLRAYIHWTISPMKLGWGEILSPLK